MFTMSLKSLMVKIFATFTFLILIGYAHQTIAAAPVLILTINGGANVGVVNGQSVLLEWYIDGSVTNCSINNGVGSIDTTVLPVMGSRSVTVPDNSSTEYKLTCSGITETVVAVMKPEVNIWLEYGNDMEIDPTSGNVGDVDVRWSSTYADRCSNVWYERNSNPGVHTAGMEGNAGSSGTLTYTSGMVIFDSEEYGYTPITETSTFYITCYNDSTGEATTESVTLVTHNPSPPSPLWLNVWSNTPIAERDIIGGYALAHVAYDSGGSIFSGGCTKNVYYEDMTPYASWPGGFWDNPYTSYDWTNVQLATTTIFEVTCTRPEVIIGGITYPEESVTDSVRVDISYPVGWVFDRTLLPGVLAWATGTPNPTVKDLIRGTALSLVTIQPRNADNCDQEAYDLAGNKITVRGWSAETVPGNADLTEWVWLATTTRLSLYCYRQYDLDFGTPAEIANGTETYEFIVEVVNPVLPIPAPQVHLYGNSLYADALYIKGKATELIGFDASSNFIMQSYAVRSGASVTFPFERPFNTFNGTDLYSIHLNLFEESDGISNFELYTEDDGLVGAWTTDNPNAADDQPVSATLINPLMGSDLDLRDGELITIKCDSVAGEFCRFSGVLFGVSNTAVAPIDLVTGEATVNIAWASDNTTRCEGLNAVNIAGGSYSWVSPGFHPNLKVSSQKMSTTTTFNAKCSRGVDGAFDISSVKIITASSSGASVYTAASLVSTGECIDPVSLLTVDAPIGYAANPITGICEPAVDLAAVSPAINLASAVEDNINGTYDNVNALIVIANLGAGALPAGSGISYKANMTFLPVYGLPVLDTMVGHFLGPLAAPVSSTSPTQSPTLTGAFNGVPFGTHTVCARVNLDDSPNFPEANLNPANNTSCSSVTLPVPPPPMTLTADREIIRSGQSVTLDWMVNVTYRLDCQVVGASGLNETFNTLSFPNPHTGSFTTGPLTSTSQYTFTCTEPITNTTFTRDVTVQMVPDYQEI